MICIPTAMATAMSTSIAPVSRFTRIPAAIASSRLAKSTAILPRPQIRSAGTTIARVVTSTMSVMLTPRIDPHSSPNV